MTTATANGRHRRARRTNGWLILAGIALLLLAGELWVAWTSGDFTRTSMAVLAFGGILGNGFAAIIAAHLANL